MKKIIGIFIMTLLIGTAVFSALGTPIYSNDLEISLISTDGIDWAKTYGGDEADKFWDVQQTDDGGYIAIGTTEEEDINYPWVLRVDSEGNEMWDWSITELTVDGEVLEIDYCWQSKVLPISDGGYILSLAAVRTNYNDDTYQFGCIIKLSSEGDEEWINILGDGFEWTIENEHLLEFEEGILVVGAYRNPLVKEDDRSGCLFKVNNIGELEWHKEYGYGEFDGKLCGICMTDDGGFLLAGRVVETSGVYVDGWLVKTDSQGEKEWEKTFRGPKQDFFWSCIKSDNGDFMIAGWTSSFGYGDEDAWVLKTDSNGNEIWNKTIGERLYDIAYDFDSTDDGGYIIPVGITWGEPSMESWVVMVDNDGNTGWKHIYGEEGVRKCFIGLCSTSDGGCIASGVSGLWDGRRSDALLVKYAASNNQRPNKPSTPTGPKRGKPDTEYTFSTNIVTDPDGDSLQYMWDWGDGNYSELIDSTEASYSWSYEDNFEVRVMAIDENGGESDWSDPLPFSTPKNKITINLMLERLLSRFPILEILL